MTSEAQNDEREENDERVGWVEMTGGVEWGRESPDKRAVRRAG